MKFLFVCGREVDYTRNHVLLRAFRRIGEVDTVVETGYAKSLIFRSARIAIRAFPKYISNRYTLIFVGFYGHLLMIPIGLFSRRPILFDAFVSTFDTLTSDRQQFSPHSLIGKMAFFLDKSACLSAKKVILDTDVHERYFSDMFGISEDKLISLPVSCNEEIFHPRGHIANKYPLILSYSTYLPIHGMDTIIKAAELLQSQPFRFKLIGHGPAYNSVNQYAKQAGLKNVTFSPMLSLHDIANEISAADICLGGHFGLSDKAGRVIPGKIYQMLAMAKPVIAADTPANKELLSHRISAFLCPPGDSLALAKAIMELCHEPLMCRNIGERGYETYQKRCSEAVITEKLRNLIMEMI